MAGIASCNSISQYIPGLTQYRFSMAKLHGLQHGRGAPVPVQSNPRFRVERQQLDHKSSRGPGPSVWRETLEALQW